MLCTVYHRGMEITVTTTDSNSIIVRAPYHPDFPAQAHRLGGTWSSIDRCWAFRAAEEEGVHALLHRIYGWTPAPSGETATIRVTLDAGNARDGEVRLAGRVIAQRYSRDGEVILDPAAVIVDGEFAASGGSKRRPAVIDDRREVTLEVTLPTEALIAATEIEWTRVEPEPEPEASEPADEPEEEPEPYSRAATALAETAALLGGLAECEPIHADVWTEDGMVGVTMGGAEFTVLPAGDDGDIIISRILPDGEEMYDYGPDLPDEARTIRLYRAWAAETHAVRARRRAESDLRADAMEAAEAALRAEEDPAPYGAYGWGDESPTWSDLTLPYGSVLRRQYVGVSDDATTGWAWEAVGRLRRADAPILEAMVRAGALPAAIAYPAIDDAGRERLRRDAAAASLEAALEEAGARPDWEGGEATLGIIDCGGQWALAVTGPDRAEAVIDPAATGTMPAWAATHAIRAWIAVTLGDDAAAHADLP